MALLNPQDIAAVSALLDQALELPATARDAWLAALPPEHQRHAEALRQMLAAHNSTRGAAFLASGPPMLADEAVAHAGDLVGPYRLQREIGRGGMGSVWLAERADGAFERQVALKLPRLAWGAGLAQRMAREREIGARLEHPAIARLYDAGVDERGRPYLAFEYIAGQPIDAWCAAQVPGLRERLKLFVQVVRAVAYAHGRLVVHRDIKPSNVLVTPDGQARLLDFGIAKLLHEVTELGLTQEQGRVLTPHYASPEQLAGEAVTVQSDVYGLGVLLYELLTGTLPHGGRPQTAGAIEQAVLQGDVRLASSRVQDKALARALRGEVDAMLAKALQRDPARRYATADALAQDIERFLAGETVSARPDSLGYRLGKALRRHWMGVGAVAAVLLALLAGSGVAAVQAHRAARAAEREQVVKAFVADLFRARARAEPGHPLGRTASMLEDSPRLIEQRFGGQPPLQADLFGVVGRVLAEMGAWHLAGECAQRRSLLLQGLASPSAEQAESLLSWAQALFEQRRFDEAEQVLARVPPVAADEPRAQAAALVLRARVQDAQLRHEAAAASLQQLQAWLAQPALARSGATAWVPFLQARILTVNNRLDEALPLYLSAIDTALAIEGPQSLNAVAMQQSLARRLVQTTQAPLAQQHFEASQRVLQELGGAHALRAAFAAASYAQHRRDYGFLPLPLAEALAILQRSQATLENAPMPIPGWWLAQIDFWRGDMLMAAGDVTAGWPLMSHAATVLEPARLGGADRWPLVASLGVAAMHAGRHDEAASWLGEMAELRRQRGRGRHPYAALDYTLQAENLIMQGRPQAAELLLAQAPHFESMRGEGLSPERYNRFVHQARARARLAASDAAGAVRMLRAWPPAADESDQDGANYQALLAEALCSTGQPRAGLAVLQRRVAEEGARAPYPHAPWLARQRAVAGLCAAGNRRGLALQLEAQARAAFTAQPGVSPYYKAPWHALRQALGLRPLEV